MTWNGNWMATSWGLPESIQGGLKGGLQRGLQTEFGLEGHLLSSSGLQPTTANLAA